jgi:curved DNA-binding protein CbpA
MKTLYDLLGTRPGDDAEALRTAFRKAAKANHPDLHAGDPYAAMRFRRIAEAYEILRDTERRANYDRLLELKRERDGRRLTGIVSYLMRSVAFDAVTAVALAIVLTGGYTIYAHISKTSAEVLARTGGRGSARIAVGQPAGPANMNKPGKRRDEPERNAGPDMMVPNAVASAVTHAPPAESTPSGSVPGAAGLNAEVANANQTAGAETLDQDSAQLVRVLSSSRESDSGGGKSFSSDFAISDDKRDIKRETHDISDIKLPETRIPPKARIAVKRQAAGHTTFEQASLENRNACSGSCLRDVPPLFGVGF